jgi:pyruvate/2-oxoglutarate dehydrogenase complex dihydrolipoamide dehydrogenase (E3) component
MKHYDAIIIGSGQAGSPLSKKLANAGKKTLLIEKRFIGGTCVNDGCTPTKTMVASARLAYLAGKCNDMGITIKGYTVDLETGKKRAQGIVMKSRTGSQAAMEKTKNLDLLFGEATFIDKKTISVNPKTGKARQFTADQIFINAGCKTIIPMILKGWMI